LKMCNPAPVIQEKRPTCERESTSILKIKKEKRRGTKAPTYTRVNPPPELGTAKTTKSNSPRGKE